MINQIRRFIERGRKGYTREEMWSFDNWLSDLIARGLKEFKENTHTYPNDIDDWEEWMRVLDEMIECFEEQGREIEMNTVDFIEQWNKRKKNKKQKLSRGMELLERYYFDLWD